jgi:hypothetical protein
MLRSTHLSHNTGSRRGPSRPTAGVLASRERTRRACAAGKVAMAVILARRSAPEWACSEVPTTPAAEHGSAGRSGGAGGLARFLLLLRTYRYSAAVLDGPPASDSGYLSGTYPLAMSDLWDDVRSVFIDWPNGVTIDEPEVRYVSQESGVSHAWEEIERIPHPSGPDDLFARIEVVFRRTS